MANEVVDKSKNVEEDVDNVQVEIESGKDVLFGWNRVLVLASEHQLSVKDQVDGKEESAERGVDQADCFAWNADGHDTENEENDDADKENATASRKVPFGLHGEDGEGQADASADSDGNQNVFRLQETFSKLILKLNKPKIA